MDEAKRLASQFPDAREHISVKHEDTVQAWNDLLGSFEYHDAYLKFVADKFQADLNLKGFGIAELDDRQIEQILYSHHVGQLGKIVGQGHQRIESVLTSTATDFAHCRAQLGRGDAEYR